MGPSTKWTSDSNRTAPVYPIQTTSIFQPDFSFSHKIRIFPKKVHFFKLFAPITFFLEVLDKIGLSQIAQNLILHQSLTAIFHQFAKKKGRTDRRTDRHTDAFYKDRQISHKKTHFLEKINFVVGLAISKNLQLPPQQDLQNSRYDLPEKPNFFWKIYTKFSKP